MCKLLAAGSLSRAVVLTAACLLLTGCPSRQPAPTIKAPCVAQGVAHLAGGRWVEPRLAEGFSWQPCSLGRRNGDVDVAACPQPPHPARRPVSIPAGNCRMHVKALTILLLDPARTDDAVEQLEELAERVPAADVQSDLAAAYAVRAQRTDWPSDLVRSAGTALKASRTPAGRSRPGVWFNLALAEQGIELNSPALDSWRTYLRLDPDSQWAGEAHQRLRRVEGQLTHVASTRWSLALERLPDFVQAGDEEALAQLMTPFRDAAERYVEEEVLPAWAAAHEGDAPVAGRALALARAIARALAPDPRKRDTKDRDTGDVYLTEVVGAIDQALHPPADRRRLALLARGHRLFGEASRPQRAHRGKDAGKLFRAADAALGRAGSPLRYSAQLGLATSGITDQAARRRALAPLAELARQADERGYKHLQGRALWIQALGLYLEDDLLESLSSYDRALASFVRLGDGEHAAGVHARKAGVLLALGERELAWREALRALRGLSSVVEVQAQHYVLGAAAGIASQLRLPRRWPALSGAGGAIDPGRVGEPGGAGGGATPGAARQSRHRAAGAREHPRCARGRRRGAARHQRGDPALRASIRRGQPAPAGVAGLLGRGQRPARRGPPPGHGGRPCRGPASGD